MSDMEDMAIALSDMKDSDGWEGDDCCADLGHMKSVKREGMGRRGRGV